MKLLLSKVTEKKDLSSSREKLHAMKLVKSSSEFKTPVNMCAAQEVSSTDVSDEAPLVD